MVDSGRPSGSRGRAIGWCPPTSRPSASRRGQGCDLVEHRHRHLRGLGPDLGNGGRLPQLAAADAAERPDGRLGRTGRVDEPARLGAEPHPGRARPAERHAAASGQQVVEERVDAGRQSGARARAVDDPADLAHGAVAEGDPQAAARERLRVDHLGGCAGQHRGPLEGRDDVRRLRRHPVAQAPPVAGVDAEELLTVALVEALPERLHDGAEPVHRRPPVARGALDAGEVLGRTTAVVGQGVAPVVDLGDRRELELAGVAGGQLPVPGDGVDPACGPARGPGQGEDDVHHGQAGADEQHVGRSGRVTAYDVEGAGSPGVGDEEGGVAQGGGSPRAARRPLPRGQDDRVGAMHLGVVGGHQDPGPVAAHAGGAHPQVAQPERQLATVGAVQGLVEVAGPLRTGSEDTRLGQQLGVLAGPPGDEVPRLLGQRTHGAGRDVEQVLLVDGAERGAPGAVGRGIEQDDLERRTPPAGGAGEVEGRQAAGGSRADHDDPRRRRCLAHRASSCSTRSMFLNLFTPL